MIWSQAWLLWVFIFIASCSTPAPPRAPDARDKLDAGSDLMLEQLRGAERIVWIAAHPDDETTVAPLLAYACLDHDADCTLLVLTQGEAGRCGGCTEDIRLVRDRELTASAATLGAQVVLKSLPDTAGDAEAVLTAWAGAGSVETLVTDLAQELSLLDPTLILTFDPRHGVTCHGAHRAAGGLAVEAAKRAGLSNESVWLITSSPQVTGEAPTFDSAGYIAMVPGDSGVWRYDATQPLASSGRSAWSYLVDVFALYTSQFSTADVAAFGNAPSDLRAIYVLPFSDLVEEDPRYSGLCQ